MDPGSIATWLGSAAAVVFGIRAWCSDRSAKRSVAAAKEQAARAARAAERSSEAQQQLAEVARNAFHPPADFDLRVEYVTRNLFRLRNIGAKMASNIRFPAQPRGEFFHGPPPTWITGQSVTLARNAWADFRIATVTTTYPGNQPVYPHVIGIEFDEAPAPFIVEVAQPR